MKIIESIDSDIVKKMPAFRVGDNLKVYLKVKEGDKTRTQVFEGICSRRRGSGASASFSVMKETHGDMVEKTLPLYSPTIEKIVAEKGPKVRRAKLYYLRTKKA